VRRLFNIAIPYIQERAATSSGNGAFYFAHLGRGYGKYHDPTLPLKKEPAYPGKGAGFLLVAGFYYGICYSTTNKGNMATSITNCFLLARPERFELPTPWFEARYSIQLSYGRVAVMMR
jgi:hypothetical protein